MKFGQGPATGISMKLPRLDLEPRAGHTSEPEDEIEVLLGAPVWGCTGWRGTLYPPKARTPDFLKHYANALPTIELNATFYGIPTEERLRKWAAETPETFRFCPKVPRGVSHSSDMKMRQEVFERFWKEFEVLGPRWGISFLQLPETFAPRSLKILQELLQQKPEGASLAVEFRHPDWFSDRALISEAKGLLDFYATFPVISDTLAKRTTLHQSYLGTETMIRFLGTEDSESDLLRLTEWAMRLEELAELGIRRAYFFVHQPHEEFAAQTLARFSDMLAESKRVKLRQSVKLFSESQSALDI